MDESTATILNGAWSILAETSQLCSTIPYRQGQFEVLLGRCRHMMQQFAHCLQNEPQDLNNMKTRTQVIEAACESVKSVLTTVDEKGFLWCLMNAEKIDGQVKECENKIENVFSMIHAFVQLTRTQQMIRAQEEDRKGLSQTLEKLCESDDRLIEAIEDQGGVHRTVQELLIAVLKHVQNLSTQNEPRPEDIFLQTAAKVLCRMSNTKENNIVAPFVMSSVEVEFDVHVPIGRGASGQVYKGDWNGAIVAVKRMHANDARIISDEQRKAIRHEVKIWSTLHHPNVLTFYGACLEATVPFLVMRYCPFGPVGRYLDEYPDADRTRLSHEVAIGLAFLHKQGIVHADVKGANVLVSEDHHAVLSDFGLALQLFRIRTQSTYSTHIDRQRGTVVFMAPEVLEGRSPDMASDVYSLSLTIWEMFSGEVPFQSYLSPELLIDGVVTRQKRPARPDRLSEDHVWDIVQRCWVADPKARPTAKEVQDALKASRKQPANNLHTRPVSDTIFSDSVHDKGICAIAQFDFKPIEDADLAFVKGERIEHIKKLNDDWWFGVSADGMKRGMFPAGYATISADEDAIALWDYISEDTGDLSFHRGDKITVITFTNDDWWHGKDKDGNVGVFPSNHVRLAHHRTV